jgi:hypothetical protein
MTTNGDQRHDTVTPTPDNNPDTVTPTPDNNPDNWLTVAQAAAKAGIHRNTVRKRLRTGQVPGAYLHPGTNGDEWRIPLASVEALRAAQRPTTPNNNPDSELVHRVRELEQELAKARAEAEQNKAAAELHEAIANERLGTIQALNHAISKLPRQVEATTSDLHPIDLVNERPRWWRRKR